MIKFRAVLHVASKDKWDLALWSLPCCDQAVTLGRPQGLRSQETAEGAGGGRRGRRGAGRASPAPGHNPWTWAPEEPQPVWDGPTVAWAVSLNPTEDLEFNIFVFSFKITYVFDI